MTKRQQEIKQLFLTNFKDAKSELKFNNEYELLVAVMLSAQCLDSRVNLITPELFKIYFNVYELANANLASLKMLIKSCNFYENKARNLILMAKSVCDEHNGLIPLEFDALIKLAGVGEKTANVVLAEALNANVMAVDTHIFRVSKRLHLSKAKTPNECAKDLSTIFKTDLAALHKAMVLFGRYTCKARNPQCQNCFLQALCKSKDKNKLI